MKNMLSRIDKAGLLFVAIVFVIGVLLLGALVAREAGAEDLCSTYGLTADQLDELPESCRIEPEEEVSEGVAWRAWAGQDASCVVMYSVDRNGAIDYHVPWLREFSLALIGEGWTVDAGYLPTSGAWIGQTPCVTPTPDETDKQDETWTLHLYVEPEPVIPGGDC